MNILVCDDDKEIVDAIEIYLLPEGYQVFKAYDGIQAIEILKREEIHLLLIDVMMPRMDGIRATLKIREQYNIPIIILSAKTEDTDKVVGLNVGADDYIAKPFSIHLLKGKIANQLKARQRLKHYYSNTIDIDTAKMTSNNLDEEFMSKAIQVVEENISNEDFTSDELASQLCMSRSSLYLKMNSISGEPPANFIRRIRFNKACKLLLEGRYSISEISGMVGFGSSSYFSTSFKKYVGCLPSEYVKQHTK